MICRESEFAKTLYVVAAVMTPLLQPGAVGVVGATLRVAIRRSEIRWRLEYRGVQRRSCSRAPLGL
ncbi:MAG: hypothetical protein ACRESR_02010 [Gammaproteobacteria bacterium]